MASVHIAAWLGNHQYSAGDAAGIPNAGRRGAMRLDVGVRRPVRSLPGRANMVCTNPHEFQGLFASHPAGLLRRAQAGIMAEQGSAMQNRRQFLAALGVGTLGTCGAARRLRSAAGQDLADRLSGGAPGTRPAGRIRARDERSRLRRRQDFPGGVAIRRRESRAASRLGGRPNTTEGGRHRDSRERSPPAPRRKQPPRSPSSCGRDPDPIGTRLR